MALGGNHAETVLRLREESRPHLALTAKVCTDQVRRGRHILTEQPAGSLAMNQPEMRPIIDLYEVDLILLFPLVL